MMPKPPSDSPCVSAASESLLVGAKHDEVAGLTDASVLTPSAETLPKMVRFESLARCGDEIWIENDGQIYRLRRTRQGKLILTK